MSEKGTAPVAETLRALRTEQGLSCYALDRLTGLSSCSIARYERGSHVPSLEQARRICEALGVSLAVFDRQKEGKS